MMQAEEERQRPGARGQSSDTASVQLRAMQRRDDLHHLELIIPPDDRCTTAYTFATQLSTARCASVTPDMQLSDAVATQDNYSHTVPALNMIALYIWSAS